MTEPRQPGSLRRRFLGIELWQQVAAGVTVVVIVTTAGYLSSHFHNWFWTTPKPQASHRSTIWLDQLTPTSGEVSSSRTVPYAAGERALSTLPHELLINSAENDNIVSYALNRKYKTFNLEAAVAGNASVSDGPSFTLNIDGKPFLLFGDEKVIYFFPGLSSPENWIINVAGAKTLQLGVGDGGISHQTAPLLVSGFLTN